VALINAERTGSDVVPPAAVGHEAATPYAYYALALLTAANVLNYLDRGIVSILAQSIKADLGLTDAQLGFLLGTAFSVLYGVAGIAIGRISDVMNRARLMAFGLALWSGMTMLAGAATGFAALAFTRIGVGVGEATANPCSHSLLSQYFPARNRAGAMGVYLAGIYLGGASALIIGGLVLQHWNDLCSLVPIGGACGVRSWQAAFLAVGLPGLLLALLISFMREPVVRPPVKNLGRLAANEFAAAVPPFTLFTLYRAGGGGAVWKNLVLLAALAAGVWLLSAITHDVAQWIAVAIGAYSICTWGHVLRLRDKPLFMLTFGCPTFVLAMFSGALIACVTSSAITWAAPYAMRNLSMSPGEVGVALGLTLPLAAGLGVVLTGLITDRWKRHDRRAPMWIGVSALVLPLPGLALMMTAHEPKQFVAGYFLFALFSTGYASAYAALVQDLVLPRMRGTASAAFSLVILVVASATGPYWTGKISTLTGSLKIGILSLQVLAPLALLLLVLAARRLGAETPETRRARAHAYGEPDPLAVP
jgi:MFS family permease